MRYRSRYFTDEQIQAAIKAWGLPDRCTDPDTLRAGAEIEVAEERRLAAEQAEQLEGDAGPDAA